MNWDTFFTTGAGTFIDVMTWVIVSLFIFELINFFIKDGLYNWIKKSKKSQVFNAAILGLIPGCGGPLLLVPLYKKGNVSLSALTASFIATFGDAAFVILSKNPEVFLHLMWISFITAIIFGYALQISGIGMKLETNIKNSKNKFAKKEFQTIHDKERALMPSWFNVLDEKIGPLFLFSAGIFLFPSTIMNLVPAWENTLSLWLLISNWIGFVATMTMICFYLIKSFMNRLYIPNYGSYIHIEGHEDEIIKNSAIAISKNNKENINQLFHDVFVNLVRIVVWVFIGLFSFEVLYFYMGDSIESLFNFAGGSITILIAIAVGMIPGCGPQIALANFFLSTGTVNLSALAGNSINQDGDAAFALIAVDVKTSMVMRFLNIIPALIVGFTLMGLNNIGISIIN